jgi:photosystem II stability/assembly factor-like uncharacterized protein
MSDLTDPETLDGENADLIYFLAAAPDAVLGQSGLVFAARGSGLQSSRDGGQTWQDALESLQISEPLPVTSLAISPNFLKDNSLFAGVPGGIFLSNDAGGSWKAAVFPPPPPTVSALAVSPNYSEDETIFAGTMEDGVFVSTSGGTRWSAWNFALLDLNVMCLAISPNFGDDETIFAGTETGIFRSTNGGRAWREVELPFGFDAIISLAFSAQYPADQLLFAGTESHGLWSSADEGQTWTRLEDFIEDPVNAVVPFPGGLLALTGAALWYTADGGQSWQNLLPEQYAGRELSAVLLPPGFAPGATLLAGFTDGEVEIIRV